MKHKKLLSMLLALVMVLSLAPTAVFAGAVGGGDGHDPGVYLPLGDNVYVQNTQKIWVYSDDTEVTEEELDTLLEEHVIPEDELAALIDQGVIPASVDIFYALLSSDDSQTGYALAEKYHPGIDAYYSEHPGSTGNAQPPYDSSYYDCWYVLGLLTSPIPEEELEALGWNADGWSSDFVSATWGEDVYDAYVNPEDIGGWSRQTLSQDNDWHTSFNTGIFKAAVDYIDDFLGIAKRSELSFDDGFANGEDDFIPCVDRYNLSYPANVDHSFTPVREFLPEGYPLVSMIFHQPGSGGGRLNTTVSGHSYAESQELFAQAWAEAGDVICEVTGKCVYDSYTRVFRVSQKAYDNGFIINTHHEDWTPDGSFMSEYDRYGYQYADTPAIFVNAYTGEKPWKDITVTKIWDDEVETSRPESITVNLLANGTVVDSQTVTADDGWVCTFESVPVYSEGTEIDYTVSEEAVPGYETTVDGFEITNTCTSGTIQIVKKTEGAQTPDGTRFTITGTPDAQDAAFRPVTVRYADFENGVYTLENVPAGKYTVTENTDDATLAGYELTVSGNGATKTLLRGDTVKFVITNKYERTTEVIPVNPTPTPAPALNTEDHYAYIIGYPDGLVRPNGTITRAEVVTVFFRMLTDASRDAIWSTSNSFTDVQLTEWFNNAISTIENGGIINGYPDGSFNPNGNITRAEFAAMAIRFFQDAKVGPSKFSDTIGHWAAEAISKAQNEGLIMGYPDGTFHPDQPITRAEAMTIFNRVLKRAPHKDHLVANMIQWPDNMNKSVWYYADVQEATNSHTYTMSDTTTSAHEIWQKLLPVRDWEAFEKAWSTAHSASNPGEVVNN